MPFGQPGELCVKGYSIMIGYINDEESTKKALVEGNWLKTGDQFILREDGYGIIVGRLKDMLIRGGENIFPKVSKHFHIFGESIPNRSKNSFLRSLTQFKPKMLVKILVNEFKNEIITKLSN